MSLQVVVTLDSIIIDSFDPLAGRRQESYVLDENCLKLNRDSQYSTNTIYFVSVFLILCSKNSALCYPRRSLPPLRSTPASPPRAETLDINISITLPSIGTHYYHAMHVFLYGRSLSPPSPPLLFLLLLFQLLVRAVLPIVTAWPTEYSATF